MIIFGNSFENLGEKTFLPFNALSCSGDGFVDDDQIQMPYVDDFGFTRLRTYAYYEGDGWCDYEGTGEPCGDDVGLTTGESAWFVANGDARQIVTAGQVKKGTYIHTFVETMVLCSSAFPIPFCPNSENVSWGDFQDDDQIQVPYVDDQGFTRLRTYAYYNGDGWCDYEGTGEPLAADEALVQGGEGFWLILQDASSTFSEVGPLAD